MTTKNRVRLKLPESLKQKLMEFRQRVWTVKSVEAVSLAVFGILLAFLAVFWLDRFFDTPSQLRSLLLLGAVLVCAVLPYVAYQWIWRKRRLDQLAILLRHKHPSIGDQLLGIVELVENDEEQARSRELCEAAVAQVAEDAQTRDLTNAVPNPRHRMFAGMAGCGFLASMALLVFSPAATGNAWARYLMPWKDIPRYTFTMIESQDANQVVPHGEIFPFEMQLTEESRWRPDNALVSIGGGEPIQTELQENGSYRFECPPQLADTTMQLTVGDYSQTIQLEPKLRPELTEISAEIKLPEYLEREENLTKDVRSGSGTFVVGSQAKLSAKASRTLTSATIDGQPVRHQSESFGSDWISIDEDQMLSIAWKDEYDLEGARNFELSLNSREDEAPSIVAEGLQRMRVVLDAESLTFNVRGFDDFGIKRMGMEWKGFDKMTSHPAEGERLLGAGSPTSQEISLAGTFNAKSLGISPQPIHLRLFAEDYLPGRERVYSPTYTLYILTPEDHAIWLTDQLSKWHKHSLDVRDRELQLYETNKQLRGLETAKLDDAATRRDIERQASNERTNGRRLNRLTSIGEELVKQASRNDEFGVGHIEKWAEMLQVLKDISSNRMPSVADLLKDAAKAQPLAANQPSKQKSGPQAGMNRDMKPGKGGGGKGDEDAAKKPAIPTLVDRESSMQPPDIDDEMGADEPPPESKGSPRLTLPVTTLAGKGGDGEACPAGDKMEEAITEQRDLLNEFEKVAEELNKVLANLEGSTLVKRLKAVSRKEYKIAGRIGDSVGDSFGLTKLVKDDVKTLFNELSTEQTDALQTVSYIMDDMQAFYERRRMVKFKTILDEMENQDVLGALRDVTDEIKNESGVTMAQCEFWSDTFDRWAEDLVDPAGGGT